MTHVPGIAESTVGSYLERLSAKDAAPGGGAAVAISAAQAAALLAMVVRITEAADPGTEARLDERRIELLNLAQKDGEAFEAVMSAMRLPRGTLPERTARAAKLDLALKGATNVPLAVMDTIALLFDEAEKVITQSKPAVISDAGIAIELMACALKASKFNVLVNLKYLTDDAFTTRATERMNAALEGKKERRRAMLKLVKKILKS